MAAIILWLVLAAPPIGIEPPPDDFSRRCAFRSECVMVYHVFTSVDSAIIKCIKQPCSVSWVYRAKFYDSYTWHLVEGESLYLTDVELLIWEGIGSGSLVMSGNGAYLIINQGITPERGRCQ